MYMQIHSKKRSKILTMIELFISETGHMVVAGVYNYLPPLLTPYSHHPL